MSPSQPSQGPDEVDDGLREGGQIAHEPCCGPEAIGGGVFVCLHGHYGHEAERYVAQLIEHGRLISEQFLKFFAAGMFGAFGRRAAHRYGGAKPWLSEWDVDAGEARHMMSAEVAEITTSL